MISLKGRFINRIFIKENWKNREAALAEKRIKLVTAVSDILDKIWTDRPAKPNSKIMIHNMTFAGRSWKEKIQDTLDRIKNIADIYVVTALDEVACKISEIFFFIILIY